MTILRVVFRKTAVNLLSDWLWTHPVMILVASLLGVILFTVFIISTDKKIDEQIIDKLEREIVRIFIEQFVDYYIKEVICLIMGGEMW